jgi:hypothetical protein
MIYQKSDISAYSKSFMVVSTFNLLKFVELVLVLVVETTYSFNYLYLVSEGYKQGFTHK